MSAMCSTYQMYLLRYSGKRWCTYKPNWSCRHAHGIVRPSCILKVLNLWWHLGTMAGKYVRLLRQDGYVSNNNNMGFCEHTNMQYTRIPLPFHMREYICSERNIGFKFGHTARPTMEFFFKYCMISQEQGFTQSHWTSTLYSAPCIHRHILFKIYCSPLPWASGLPVAIQWQSSVPGN